MIQKFIASLLTLFILLNTLEAKTCKTREDYLNKMLLLNVYETNIMHKILESPYIKKPYKEQTDYYKDKLEMSHIFEKDRNNFKDACKIYDKLVKKYNINIKESAKEAITVKELGKRKGMCNAAEAGILSFTFMMKADTVTNGKFSQSPEGKKFMKSTKEMLKKPGKFCENIKKLAPKYGISFEKLFQQTKQKIKKGPKTH